jgi:hypothetical protein
LICQYLVSPRGSTIVNLFSDIRGEQFHPDYSKDVGEGKQYSYRETLIIVKVKMASSNQEFEEFNYLADVR